jgi:hypothetical protein
LPGPAPRPTAETLATSGEAGSRDGEGHPAWGTWRIFTNDLGIPLVSDVPALSFAGGSLRRPACSQMTMTPAGPAQWITDGRADTGLVATEIARGPQVPVPSGYWGVEAITGCGHRMARSGFTAGAYLDRPEERRGGCPGQRWYPGSVGVPYERGMPGPIAVRPPGRTPLRDHVHGAACPGQGRLP